MSELTSIAVSDSPSIVRLKDKYKQELVQDGRLNKAADVAARREVLLTSHEPVAWKEPQLKAVGRELRQWVKRARQPFGNLESPNANAAPEDDGVSPLNHMMAQMVKNAASGQSPIKTPPNRRVPKRSRIPTPVVTPSTRKAKKQRQLPDTSLTGFEALPGGYPWTSKEHFEEAQRKTDKAVRTAKRTLKGEPTPGKKKNTFKQAAGQGAKQGAIKAAKKFWKKFNLQRKQKPKGDAVVQEPGGDHDSDGAS